MRVFDANIALEASAYLKDQLNGIAHFEVANQKLRDTFGITAFFENNKELEALKDEISNAQPLFGEPDRAEYGDFQTNPELANKVAQHLSTKGISPEIIVEPTCGKGHFIMAALQNFHKAEQVFGIEIHKPYVWETKFNIVHFFLKNPQANRPEITIAHCNVFDFDFKKIAKQHAGKEILVLGNPPWVTNAMLGSLNSANLPKKSNFKNHSGLDAMTGKGNFDIAEFITLMMINTFQCMNGNLLLLVKNSVVKNLLFDQFKNRNHIGSIEKHSIDSKKEFSVSVEASLFSCKLNNPPEFDCSEFSFYRPEKPYLKFGWTGGKFVSNIDSYLHSKTVDGECPFVWRQGIKHDCSTVMELDKVNGHYVNGLGEETNLEEGLVYGLLKSSDLKNTLIDRTRKFTIVTQRKVGQETRYIKSDYPKTYQYLTDHQLSFAARKSSIYLNKPLFSIFGIGDYSFKPFKVAISGLYKTFHFTLVLPQDGKPVMLDDTCYLIGFEKIEFAAYALILLNSKTATDLLKSITFPDAKRTFTKDVLMRVDLLKLAENIGGRLLENELHKLNEMYGLDLNLGLWPDFLEEMQPAHHRQIELFA